MGISSINSNISALQAQNSLSSAGSKVQKSISSLSSGQRIIQASDDVAGLSIGTILRTQVSTLKQALSNTLQGNSLLSIADAGLAEIGDILQRQMAIAVQSKSGTLSSAERGFLDQEFQALADEIDRLSTSTKFNSINLLDGSIYGANNAVSDTRTNVDYNGDGNTVADDFDDLFGEDRVATRTANVVFGDALITGVRVIGGGGAANAGVAGDTVRASSVTGNTAAAASDGIINNTSFIGTLSGFEATYTAANTMTVSIEVGGIEYTSTAITTTSATTITFTGIDIETGAAAGGSFDFVYAGTAATTIQTQADADVLAARINTAFSTVDFYQVRNFNADSTGFDANSVGVRRNDSATTVVTMTGAIAQLRSEDFSNVVVEDVRVEAPQGGGTAVTIEIDINGETYRNTAVTTTLATTAATALTSTTNNQHILYLSGIQILAAGAITTDENAQVFETALKDAFGLDEGNSKLSFQVGSTSSEVIKIGVAAADTDNLYDGKDLNVTTSDNADIAISQLNIAINTVTALRADVGASQSRFNATASTLESAIATQDAARSQFLDADIAATSTEFANAQVLMQASISVLAQANLLPQNILKLLG